jgi:hypothetical protein
MNRGHAALIVLACITAAFAVAFTWQHGIASLYDDSVSYLVMAQAMSPWESAPAPIAAAFPDQRYPPLFALWLGVMGGAYDWRIAHAWVALSFAAGVLLLGLLARDVLRAWWPAFAAALVFACMPGAWLNVKGILTEFPYIEVSLATLIAYRCVAARPERGRLALLAALLAAAALTRTIGVALIAAVAIAEGWHWLRGRNLARLRGFAIACGAAILALGAWYVLRPAGGEDAYASFSSAVARNTVDRGPGWLAGLVANNLSSIVDAWLTAMLIFWGEPWKPGFLIACFFGVSGVAGVVWRAARREADAIYVLVFAAILAAWPFPGQMYRLALPAFPLVAMNALWLWQELLGRIDPARAARWSAIAAGAPLVMAFLALGYIAMRPSDKPSEELAVGYRVTDIAEYYRIPYLPSAYAVALAEVGVIADMQRIGASTPDGATVMWYLPEYVAVLAGRRGVALDRPSDGRGLAAQLRAKRPDFLYLSAVHPRDTAHRDGDPMASLPYARKYGREVWRRDDGRGATAASLIAIDPSRLPSQ